MNNYRKPAQKRFSRRQRHYTPPIPPKRCVVENIIAGVKMYHDETKRVLRDVLNETGAYHMSKTDVVKIAIERLLEAYAPQVKIVKTRKLYIRLEI